MKYVGYVTKMICQTAKHMSTYVRYVRYVRHVRGVMSQMFVPVNIVFWFQDQSRMCPYVSICVCIC